MGACYANGYSDIFISINRLWNLSNSGSTDSVSHSISFFLKYCEFYDSHISGTSNNGPCERSRRSENTYCPMLLLRNSNVPWDIPSPPTGFNVDEDIFPILHNTGSSRFVRWAGNYFLNTKQEAPQSNWLIFHS